jgi:hypothetical protein
MLKLMCRP